MVLAILNLSELKFYLSVMSITEKFFPLRLFFKNTNMFSFKGDTCTLWNILQIMKNKKVKTKFSFNS